MSHDMKRILWPMFIANALALSVVIFTFLTWG